jgi:hypothetical protein
MEDKTTDVKEGELSVEEKLALAAESSTTETVEEETTEEAEGEEGKGTEDNRVPYKRFSEVNTALKESKAAQEVSQTQLAEAQGKVVKLAELLESKDDDVRTLNEIKSFVNDPLMKEHVMAIDAKLRGIEEEEEAGEIKPDEAVARAQNLLEETREEIADTQADIQADALIQRSDIIAEQLLAALPREYNDQDRAVINELFTGKVDWDAAVATPDQLSEILTQGFQKTIDAYGVPRGALFTGNEVEELIPDETTNLTPEQELEQEMGKEWGAVKEVEVNGVKKTVAELTDTEFNALQAKIIRVASGR